MSEVLEALNVRRKNLLEETAYDGIWGRTLSALRGVDARGLPRHGLLTLIARRTTFLLYDHPRVQGLCSTAFTDGSSVFVNVDFFRQMLLEEQANPRTQFVLFALMHELNHKALDHVQRSHNIAKTEQEHEIMNIAQDIFMNMRLLRGYPDIQWSPSVVGASDGTPPCFPGCTGEEVDRYWTFTEPQIYADIYNRAAAARQAYKDGYRDGAAARESAPGPKQGDEGAGARPQSGAQGQQGGADPSAGQGAGQGAGTGGGANGDPLAQAYAQGYADGKAGKVPLTGAGQRHTITPEELRDVLDKEGLSEAADKLKLPRRGDRAGFEARAKTERQQLQRDVEHAQEIRRNGGKMPGGHVEEAFQTAITELYEPKLSIRTALRKLIEGEGLHLGYSESLPDPVYYLSPETLGASHPVYDGTYLPAENEAVVVVIVDTSGSMSDEALHVVFSEAFGIVSEDPLQAPQVRLYSADTVIRGEPLELTPENWEEKVEGLRAYGRGGTNLQVPLEAALEAMREERRPLAGIVYFTDTAAAAPDFEALGDPLPPILFVAPEEDPFVSTLREEVGDYAQVVAIDEMKPGQEIELAPRP